MGGGGRLHPHDYEAAHCYHYGLFDLKATFNLPNLGNNREFEGLIVHSGMILGLQKFKLT